MLSAWWGTSPAVLLQLPIVFTLSSQLPTGRRTRSIDQRRQHGASDQTHQSGKGEQDTQERYVGYVVPVFFLQALFCVKLLLNYTLLEVGKKLGLKF